MWPANWDDAAILGVNGRAARVRNRLRLVTHQELGALSQADRMAAAERGAFLRALLGDVAMVATGSGLLRAAWHAARESVLVHPKFSEPSTAQTLAEIEA